jgi:hypothetical protein
MHPCRPGPPPRSPRLPAAEGRQARSLSFASPPWRPRPSSGVPARLQGASCSRRGTRSPPAAWRRRTRRRPCRATRRAARRPRLAHRPAGPPSPSVVAPLGAAGRSGAAVAGHAAACQWGPPAAAAATPVRSIAWSAAAITHSSWQAAAAALRGQAPRAAQQQLWEWRALASIATSGHGAGHERRMSCCRPRFRGAGPGAPARRDDIAELVGPAPPPRAAEGRPPLPRRRCRVLAPREGGNWSAPASALGWRLERASTRGRPQQQELPAWLDSSAVPAACVHQQQQ